MFSQTDIQKAPFALIQKVRWLFEIYGCEDCGAPATLKVRTAKCPTAFTSEPGAAEAFEFYEVWSVIPDKRGGIKIFGGRPPRRFGDKSAGDPLTTEGPHDVFGESSGGPFTQTLAAYELSGEFFVVPLSGSGSLVDPYEIPGGWEKWKSDRFKAAKLKTAHAMCVDELSPELSKHLKVTLTGNDGKKTGGVGRSLVQTWNCCELFSDPPKIDIKYSPVDEGTNIDLTLP